MLTDHAMHRIDAYRVIRRRAAAAGFKVRINCHTFQATGITAYLEAGGTLENAQAIAAHESPRTTKLYDRTGERTIRGWLRHPENVAKPPKLTQRGAFRPPLRFCSQSENHPGLSISEGFATSS